MEVQNIPIGEVHPSPMNPRKTIDEDAIQELADNIRQQGLIQPITIRPTLIEEVEPGSGEVVRLPGGYEIVCGERRYRAVSKLNAEDPERWATIAAIVRELTDDEAYDAMITENLHRKDVDPIEEAFAFSQLVERGHTAEEIALRFGKSIRFVQDRVKLNNLIPELLLKIREGSMAIAAGMIICKFEEASQHKFLKAYGGYDKIGKDVAQRFLNSEFMTLNRSPWYQSDNQADEDFEGGCNRKCAECPLNTANTNCLFWEMKATDDGKCTNRSQFEAKHRAYLFHYLDGIADELVKEGEALEYGKTVIVDTANCWNAEAQRIHGDVVAGIKERGFEIVKPDEIFGNRVYYQPTDERIPEMLKNGECYRCIDVFGNGELPAPKVVHYRIKPITKDAPVTPGEVAPPEAVKLVGQFKRNTEICNEKLCKCNQEMARDLGPTKRRGPLKEEEQLGFDMFILSQLNSEFFAKYYNICKSSGMRPTVQELADIAKGNTDDRDLWYREYVRTKMIEGSYPGSLASAVCGDVLRLWMPDKVHEEHMKHINALDKRNGKIKERLEELGYDVHGKKLATEKKADKVKTATDAEAECLSQFGEMKKIHKDALLLFRIGDNYVAYNDDAGDVFSVTLQNYDTKKVRGQEVQISKFPVANLDTILPKLVRAGKQVAICENLEDHKNKK